MRIGHVRHCDQEVMRQIDAAFAHAGIVIATGGRHNPRARRRAGSNRLVYSARQRISAPTLTPTPLTTSPQAPSALCWFRRDLRDHDHAALTRALDHGGRVLCAFVFDRAILDRLEQRADRRVEFIWESVRELDAAPATAAAG
ncbi:MAG: deoxyribodipyrimidine photo-lyase [Betaproteobacteria bacterium]|nr:deoxyribodipyrimidine photo-lyase [Betaproteobacteria bacterium]